MTRRRRVLTHIVQKRILDPTPTEQLQGRGHALQNGAGMQRMSCDANQRQRPKSACPRNASTSVAERLLVTTLEQYPLNSSRRRFVHSHRKLERPHTARVGLKVTDEVHCKAVQNDLVELLAGLEMCVGTHVGELLATEKQRNQEVGSSILHRQSQKQETLLVLHEKMKKLEALVEAQPEELLTRERDQLLARLNVMSKSWQHKRALKQLDKQTWELQNRCDLLKRRRKELNVFVTTRLPKELRALKHETSQKAQEINEAEAQVALLEEQLADLRSQERMGRFYAALDIQAWFRGVRVRIVYHRFKRDRSQLQDASLTLYRKLRLHIPHIASLLISRDAISKALSRELTCQHCFQNFRNPVWLITPLETECYCQDCAHDLQGTIYEHTQCKLLPNSLVISLQERLNAKELAFRDAGKSLEELKRNLIVKESFDSTLRNMLRSDHLYRRFEIAGLGLPSRTKKTRK